MRGLILLLQALGPLLDIILKGISYFMAYRAGKNSEHEKQESAQDAIVKDALKSDAELAKLTPEELSEVARKQRELFK
jgi:hypothetical protein